MNDLNNEHVYCINSTDLHDIKNILSSAKLSLEMLTTYDLNFKDREKLTLQAFNSVSQSITTFENMLSQKNNN